MGRGRRGLICSSAVHPDRLSPHPHEAVVGPVPAHLGLARAVPALGVGLGVVLSVRQIGRVLETAEHLYTERFLQEKYLTAPVAIAA